MKRHTSTLPHPGWLSRHVACEKMAGGDVRGTARFLTPPLKHLFWVFLFVLFCFVFQLAVPYQRGGNAIKIKTAHERISEGSFGNFNDDL